MNQAARQILRDAEQAVGIRQQRFAKRIVAREELVEAAVLCELENEFQIAFQHIVIDDVKLLRAVEQRATCAHFSRRASRSVSSSVKMSPTQGHNTQ